MILSFFFVFLLLLCISLILFFTFSMLLPSLNAKNVHIERILFSTKEFSEPQVKKNEVVLSDKRAVVLCARDSKETSKQLQYSGIRDCGLFSSLYDSEYECTKGCVGFGDCSRVCPVSAIVIRNGIAEVTASCIGCGICVDSCPKHLIKLFDNAEKDVVACVQTDEDSELNQKNCPSAEAKEVPPKYKKLFQFWAKCYRIVHKGNFSRG